MRLLDPAAIEAEIAASIERSADGIARASLFNLVLFDHVRTPTPLASSLDYLLGRRPARIVHVQRGYDGPTEAHVSARCYPDRRRQGVCFQEVHILNGSDDRGLDPGSWGALLIRDIPVFGLLSDPSLTIGAEAALLGEVADKLILDSASFTHERSWATIAALARLIAGPNSGRDAEPRPAVADLAWLRLLAVRRAIARAFHLDTAGGSWQGIRAVDCSGGSFAEAALLGLWLASRLGWRLVQALAAEAQFEDPRGIAVRFSHTHLFAGLKAVIVLDGGESIEVSLDDGTLRTRAADGTAWESPGKQPAAGPLVLQEVDTVRGDPLYYAAVGCASAFDR